MTEDQVNAIAYALAKIEGTDGGYSPEERSKHKAVLQTLLQQGIQEVTAKEQL